MFDRTTVTSSRGIGEREIPAHRSPLATAINVVAFIVLAGGIIGGAVVANHGYRTDVGAFLLFTVASIAASVPMFGLARCVRAADRYLEDKADK